MNGILKYGIDYAASPLYETGYADRAEKNVPLYGEIALMFGGKRNIGVSVACRMKRLEERYIPSTDIIGGNADDGFFQPEQYFMTCNSIPITYGDGADVKIAFGENARYISMEEKGFILDVPGARYLEARGIDTGLVGAKPAEAVSEEVYPACGEHLGLADARGLYTLEVKAEGRELSFLKGKSSGASAVAYENADGKRFLILGCDGERVIPNNRFYRNYCRQAQLMECIEWLGGRPLPAAVPKNPELYVICKRGESSMAVALFNVFFDAVLEPVIKLDKSYSSVRFAGCSGRLEGDRVILDGDIGAFSQAFFEVFD